MAQSSLPPTATTFTASALHLSQRALQALGIWISPEQNPFLLKALRLEARSHKPLVTVSGVSVLALVFCVFIWRLWLYLQYQIASSPPDTWSHRSMLQIEAWLVGVFGKHPVGWFALATALAGALGVLYVGRSRSAYLLRQELIKNTLVQLQQLPIAEERWLWLMAAHPALIGLLVGALGLPVYLLAVFVSQWSLLDVAGLLIFFIVLGHAAPAWTPAAWQQNARGKGQKLTWRQWRELQRQAQLAARSGDIVSTLEQQRQMQRALSGWPESATDEAPAGKKSPSGSGRRATASGLNAGLSAGTTGGFNWFWGWVGLSFLFQLGRGLGFTVLRPLTEAWPPEVLALLPGFIVAWPLIAAKLLVAPLPFFAFYLPPVCLLIPLWITASHQSFLNLAASVSAAETFWTSNRLHRRTWLSWLLAGGVLCFLFGYLWPVLIEGGELARLLRGAPPNTEWAIAAGWTLAIVAGAFIGGQRMEAPFRRAHAGTLEPAHAQREGAHTLARMAIFCGGAYFVFCWLGGQSGVNAVWLERLPLTLCTALAIVVADFGSASLGVVLPRPAQRFWGWLRALWFHGLGALALVLIARGAWLQKPFNFEDAPFVLLSPFVTLFALFRADASGSHTQLWTALALQLFIGATCLLLARHALSLAPAATGEAVTGASTPGEGGHPTLLSRIEKAVLFPFQFLLKALDGFINSINDWNHAVVRRGQVLGNAVLVYELRRRLRKENWAWLWLAILAAEAIGFALLAQPWQFFTAIIKPTVLNYADWGNAVTYVVLFLMALLGALACLGIGRAFDADRANGTLVFLFLTPQTDREILLGKWLCGIFYTLGLLATGLPWLVCGVFVAVVLGGRALTGVLALCALVCLASGVLFLSMLNLFFAVRARKPTEGQGWALLASLIIEGILLALPLAVILKYSQELRQTPGEVLACAVFFTLTLGQGVLAYLFWRLALRAFSKRRYGDIEATGKGVSG